MFKNNRSGSVVLLALLSGCGTGKKDAGAEGGSGPAKDVTGQANITNMRAGLTNFLNAEPVKCKAGTEDAMYLDYSMTMGEIHVDRRAYFVVDDGSGYAITCFAPKGKREAYLPKFEAVVKTFTLK